MRRNRFSAVLKQHEDSRQELVPIGRLAWVTDSYRSVVYDLMHKELDQIDDVLPKGSVISLTVKEHRGWNGAISYSAQRARFNLIR